MAHWRLSENYSSELKGKLLKLYSYWRLPYSSLTLRTIRNCPITVIQYVWGERCSSSWQTYSVIITNSSLRSPQLFSPSVWTKVEATDRQTTDKAMPPAWINNVLNIFMSNCLYRLTALIWNIALGDGNCKPGNTYTNTFTDRVRQLTMIRHVILFYSNSKGEWSNSILCWDRFDIVPKRPRDSQADASCSSDVWLCTGNSNSAQIPGHSCKTASEMGA